MPPALPPHVKCVRNKTGRPYYYLTRHRGTGRQQTSHRLPDDQRAPEFWREYARLMGIKPEPVRIDTFEALIAAWQASPEWAALAPKTRTEWSRYCARILSHWGHLEVRGVETKHVIALRDRYRETPAAANLIVATLSIMMSWSVQRGWRQDNPCREATLLKRSGTGYAPWSWDVIESAERDLRPDLWWAVALALYTGQRLGDVLAMRWSAISGDLLSVKQGKTGKELMIPIHRELQRVLNAVPRRAVTILTTSGGKPSHGAAASRPRGPSTGPQSSASGGLCFTACVNRPSLRC